MSMLSKQCKELRTEAERIGYWNPTASRLMFDAADILWSLRNKNVALLGENEKLHVELTDLRLNSCPSCGIKVENEELRELVADMMRFFEDGDYCTVCEKVAECESLEEYESDCLMRGVFKRRMAELGVEVDE